MNSARLHLKSAQKAYAAALAEHDLATETADDVKAARGVAYTDGMDDDAVDAMCDKEEAIDASLGVRQTCEALTQAEHSLIAWGIGIACEMAPNPLELRDPAERARTSAVARQKVAALCARLAV